jgi:hypothetical protein
MSKIWLIAAVSTGFAAGLLGFHVLPSVGAQLPAALSQDCSCSQGIVLNAGKDNGLHVWNCSCAAMQCVVSTHADRRAAAPVLSCR